MPKPSKKKLKLLAKVRKSLDSDIWSAHLSEKHENRIYYHNKLTKTSTWALPDEEEISSTPTKELNCKQSTINNVLSTESPTISKPAKLESRKADDKKNSQKPNISKAPITYDSNNNNKSNSKIAFKLKDIRSSEKTVKNVTIPKQNVFKNYETKMVNSPKGLIQKSGKIGCHPTTLNKILPKSNNDNIFQHNVKKACNKTCVFPNADFVHSTDTIVYHSPISERDNPILQNFVTDNSNDIVAKHEAEIEMMDVCVTEEKQTATNAVIFVVVDTNILLNSGGLKEIDSLVNRFPLPPGHFRRIIVVIPWVVLQELDGLKKSNMGKAARNAVIFLNNHFMSKKPGIRGQTILEAAFVIDGLDIEVNDDRLLQCSFFFQQLPGKHFTVMYSKDRNLCNKTMVNNIRTFSSMTCLDKGITDLCCGDTIMLDTQDIKFVQTNNTEATQMFKSPTRDFNVSNVKEKDEFEQEDIYENDEMFSQGIEMLRKTLSIILTREMVEAYGKELWQDIVLIKPPWTLLDVLQCMKKHWLAVFSMIGIDRFNQNLMLDVHDYVKGNLNKSLSSHEESSKEERIFLYKSIQFVKGLCKGRKYTQVIKENIQKLQKIHRNYGKYKCIINNEIDETKCSPMAKPITIKLSEETTKSHINIFWVVLDEVWMSIINHCISIFNTLQFSPSPIREIPRELILGENRAFNPTPEICVSVLPLLIQLTHSLLQAIERFISTFTGLAASPSERDCLDFLQTLWTTTQAFSLHTNVESIKPASLCRLNSSDDVTKLHVGGEKLNSVYLILQECKTFVTKNSIK